MKKAYALFAALLISVFSVAMVQGSEFSDVSEAAAACCPIPDDTICVIVSGSASSGIKPVYTIFCYDGCACCNQGGGCYGYGFTVGPAACSCTMARRC